MDQQVLMDPDESGETFAMGGEPLCLEFVNTVSSRNGKTPHEWLSTYPNLVAWANLAHLISPDQAQSLLRQAESEPAAAESVWRRALTLRDAFYRLISAHAAGQPMHLGDMQVLNRELLVSNQHLQLLPQNGSCCTWCWSEDPTALDSFLWPVVRSAADLLSSPDLDRTGECQNPTCGWLFLDTSKNLTRRWCDMNSCGNTAKARSFYRRKRQQKVR